MGRTGRHGLLGFLLAVAGGIALLAAYSAFPVHADGSNQIGSRSADHPVANTASTPTPAWTFIGPEPMQNVAPNFGGLLFPPTPIPMPTSTPGPSPGSFSASGRVTAIAFASASTIFVGTANGGLWRSTNSGASFQPITIAAPGVGVGTQAIGAIAVSAGPPIRVYVASGEANNGADSYYGQGIYESKDLGNTWTALNFSIFRQAAFSKLAIVPNSKGPTIFAAAGLGYSAGRGDPDFQETDSSRTSGLFRSTDGGASWFHYIGGVEFFTPTPTPAPTPTSTATPAKNPIPTNFGCTLPEANNLPCPADDVAVDPNNPDNVYTSIQSDDVFASSDGGVSWAAACLVPGHPCFPNHVGELGRTSLTVGPAAMHAPNCSGGQPCGTVFAMVGAADGQEYIGLFESTNGGVAWSTALAPPTFLNHNANVAIDGPSSTDLSLSSNDQVLFADSRNLFFGGIGLYGSTDSGASWTFMAQNGGTHSGQHAIAENGTGNVYVGNNGGLFSFSLPVSGAINGPATFTSLNSTLGSGLIQSIAPDPRNDNKVLAGFQDNGVQMFNATSPPFLPLPPNLSLAPSSLAWSSVDTGDGGFTLIDHTNSNLAYHTFSTGQTGVSLSRSSDGGFTWDSSGPTSAIQQALGVVQDRGANLYPPLAGDASVAGRVLFGAHFIYASTDGMLSWQPQEGSDLGGGCGDGSCALQDIEIARSDDSKGWALSIASNSRGPGVDPLPLPYIAPFLIPYQPEFATTFRIFNTTQANLNSGAAWNEVTDHLPFTFFLSSIQATGITIDPTNAATAYLTLSGSRAATGVGHLYRTTNFGGSWSMLDGPFFGVNSLPDVPALRLMVDRSDVTGATLYLGTDLGVYRSTDSGATWSGFNQSTLPPVPVFDLEENDNNLIFAGTHGRGAWAMQAPPPAPVSLTVTPSTINFGSSIVFGSTGQAVTPRQVTVTDPQNSKQERPVLITAAPQIVGAPDFSIATNGCGSGLLLAPNGGCTVKVGFQPTALGIRTATLEFFDSATNAPQSVSLTGTGVPGKLSISPPSLNFAPVKIGNSATLTVTLSNNNSITMGIEGIAITGIDPSDFSSTTTCGSTLGAEQRCTVAVSFSPTIKGPLSAALILTDDAAGSPQTVKLSGQGD